MKDNILTLKNKNGKKQDYRILLNIENKETNKNYVIYTMDTKNKDNKSYAYASSYELSEKGNMIKFKSVEDKKELNFIKKVLNSLQIGGEK